MDGKRTVIAPSGFSRASEISWLPRNSPVPLAQRHQRLSQHGRRHKRARIPSPDPTAPGGAPGFDRPHKASRSTSHGLLNGPLPIKEFPNLPLKYDTRPKSIRPKHGQRSPPEPPPRANPAGTRMRRENEEGNGASRNRLKYSEDPWGHSNWFENPRQRRRLAGNCRQGRASLRLRRLPTPEPEAAGRCHFPDHDSNSGD